MSEQKLENKLGDKLGDNKRSVMSYVLRVLLPIVLIAIDQVTKALIVRNISFGSYKPIIDDFFALSHVRNTGAAWGLFSDKTLILSIVTLIACCLIAYLVYAAEKKLLLCSLVLILSGAIGNVIDRVRLGYVIDFLRFTFGTYEFPNFNVADMCITCGGILLIISMLFVYRDMSSLFRKGTFACHIMSDKHKHKNDGEVDDTNTENADNADNI